MKSNISLPEYKKPSIESDITSGEKKRTTKREHRPGEKFYC